LPLSRKGASIPKPASAHIEATELEIGVLLTKHIVCNFICPEVVKVPSPPLHSRLLQQLLDDQSASPCSSPGVFKIGEIVYTCFDVGSTILTACRRGAKSNIVSCVPIYVVGGKWGLTKIHLRIRDNVCKMLSDGKEKLVIG
jgi:hypothetical protein